MKQKIEADEPKKFISKRKKTKHGREVSSKRYTRLELFIVQTGMQPPTHKGVLYLNMFLKIIHVLL